MGLDSVEILMKVEDTFGIKIPNREAEQILTVGDFHNVVWKRLQGKPNSKCLSQGLFYKLRRAFVEKFNITPHELHPELSPENIFPKAGRREAYLNFAETTNLKLPALVLTQGWETFLIAFGLTVIAGALGASLILINYFDFTKWTLLFPVAGIALTILLSNLLNPLRIRIQDPTVRAFTERTLVLNYSKTAGNTDLNRQEMEMIINHIIADMSGLELEEISAEKKIGDDLGID